MTSAARSLFYVTGLARVRGPLDALPRFQLRLPVIVDLPFLWGLTCDSACGVGLFHQYGGG